MKKSNRENMTHNLKNEVCVFIKSLINHCYLSSVGALISTIEKHIPFVGITVHTNDSDSETLKLEISFEHFVCTYHLIIEKRANNSFYIKDIIK